MPIDVMPGFNVDVAALGQNFCVIASKVQSNPQFIDVYYRRVDGVTRVPLDGSPVLAGISYSYNARIHADGTRWIATWERHPTHDDPQSSVQYTFINSDGSHTPEGSVNSAFTSSGGQPDVAMSGNRLLFVWRSNSHLALEVSGASRERLRLGTATECKTPRAANPTRGEVQCRSNIRRSTASPPASSR